MVVHNIVVLWVYEIRFWSKPTKCAFRNERQRTPEIAIEACDLKASEPMGSMVYIGYGSLTVYVSI